VVPPDIIASDLYEPSVDYGKPEQGSVQPIEPPLGSEAPSASEPEVMEIDEDQPEGDHELDWRIPYLECLIRGVLPSD
jgi:hypothetical protein